MGVTPLTNWLQLPKSGDPKASVSQVGIVAMTVCIQSKELQICFKVTVAMGNDAQLNSW